MIIRPFFDGDVDVLESSFDDWVGDGMPCDVVDGVPTMAPIDIILFVAPCRLFPVVLAAPSTHRLISFVVLFLDRCLQQAVSSTFACVRFLVVAPVQVTHMQLLVCGVGCD